MLSKLSKLSEEYNVAFSFLSAFIADYTSGLDCDFDDQSGAMCVLVFVTYMCRLLTQHVADPGATMTFVAGGALKPIGGHILSHASATRMFLRKGAST